MKQCDFDRQFLIATCLTIFVCNNDSCIISQVDDFPNHTKSRQTAHDAQEQNEKQRTFPQQSIRQTSTTEDVNEISPTSSSSSYTSACEYKVTPSSAAPGY